MCRERGNSCGRERRESDLRVLGVKLDRDEGSWGPLERGYLLVSPLGELGLHEIFSSPLGVGRLGLSPLPTGTPISVISTTGN